VTVRRVYDDRCASLTVDPHQRRSSIHPEFVVTADALPTRIAVSIPFAPVK